MPGVNDSDPTGPIIAHHVPFIQQHCECHEVFFVSGLSRSPDDCDERIILWRHVGNVYEIIPQCL